MSTSHLAGIDAWHGILRRAGRPLRPIARRDAECSTSDDREAIAGGWQIMRDESVAVSQVHLAIDELRLAVSKAYWRLSLSLTAVIS